MALAQTLNHDADVWITAKPKIKAKDLARLLNDARWNNTPTTPVQIKLLLATLEMTVDSKDADEI